MPKQAERVANRSLQFTSHGSVQLEVAIALFLGSGGTHLCWKIDEDGHHLMRVAFEEDAPDGWEHVYVPGFHNGALIAATMVSDWLTGLDYNEKRRICRTMPMEETYMRDPSINLVGFTATGWRTEDRANYTMTVRPAWV